MLKKGAKGHGKDFQNSLHHFVLDIDFLRAWIFEIQELLSVEKLLCVCDGFI
jgi:hypothetical protein